MYTEYYVFKSGDILVTKGTAYVISEHTGGLAMRIVEAGETWHRNSDKNELFLYITSSRSEAKHFLEKRNTENCKRVYSKKVDKCTPIETDYDPDYVW